MIGARKLVFFWHQSEARTAATVWNWSGKTLSTGALLAVLYFSSCLIFRAFRLSSPPPSAPGSPRMVITKTKRGLCFRNYEKTPKFTVEFDLKRGGKNPTEDNLTD